MDFITKVCLSRGKTAAGKYKNIFLKGGRKMESRLMFSNLIKDIVDAVQAEIEKIPDFNSGAIRLQFAPKCDEAAENITGFGLLCELGLSFPVKVGASYTRPAGWRGNSSEPECDCNGYAALKIGGCTYAIKNGFGYRSRNMPTCAVTWGRENDPGCVAYDICAIPRMGNSSNSAVYKPLTYVRIYISVSGATGEEDEQCALASGNVIQKWCDNGPDEVDVGYKEKILYCRGPETCL